MNERLYKNISCLFGWISIGALFALITLSSSLEIKDLDLWLHLRMGYWISHHGFVPSFDVLSCTIAGKPWVNHEWLFQVLVYQVQNALGFDGLINMQTFVVTLTFVVLLFMGYSRERQWLVVLNLLMVLMVYESRFTIRPDIFSLLFFVLYMYILSIHINKRWALYALVLLQILWSNMHGFFFFGPMLVMIGILSEFIKRRLPLPYEWNTVGRLNDDEYLTLKKLLPLLILACCVNPLTFKGAWYPVSVFFHLAGDNKIFFDHIFELQKPITAATVFTDRYSFYKILIILSSFSFVFNRRKVDISSLLIWIIFLGFSLVAIRNLVYFAVAAYMVIMVNVMSIAWESIVPLRFTSGVFKYLTGIVFKIFLIVVIVLWIGQPMLGNGYFDFDNYNRKSEFFGVSKRAYPNKAVDFLIRQHVKGNFFNDFNSGAYMVGRLNPNIKVFIDGRTEVYGPKFFETYQKIWQNGNAKVFADLERRDDITGALLNNARQDIPAEVLKMFYGFKNWSIVYLDDDAVIFLKQTPLNKAIIERFAVNINKWQTKPMDLLRVGTSRVDPFPFISRAHILESLGADDAALNELKSALTVAPDDASAYIMMGKIYAKRKNIKAAFDAYRLGVIYSGDQQGRIGMAQGYEDLKHYNQAIVQYQKVLKVAPKNIWAYFGLARTYAEINQDKKALDMLAAAVKLGIEDKVDVKKIHDIINGRKIKALPLRVLKKQTLKKVN